MNKTNLNILGIVVCVLVVTCNLGFGICSEGVELHHRPENVHNGYRIVSVIETGDVKNINEDRIDIPHVVVEQTGATVTIDIEMVGKRGLPIYLPMTPVSVNSTWEGWGEATSADGAVVVYYQYTFKEVRMVAGRRCAEIVYILKSAPKPLKEGSASLSLNGSGQILFDIDNGVVVIHTYRLDGGHMKLDYASALNL